MSKCLGVVMFAVSHTVPVMFAVSHTVPLEIGLRRSSRHSIRMFGVGWQLRKTEITANLRLLQQVTKSSSLTTGTRL